jgi:hypothetical protein
VLGHGCDEGGGPGTRLKEMTMTGDRERKAAEAKFKKSERARNSRRPSHVRIQRGARGGTCQDPERLRALRLAKEAADKSKK